jgi:sulfite reductase (NADPH) flavoprotein alpha-component
MRCLHSLTGLIATLIVMFMAITGAILSLAPALEAASARTAGAVTTVATLAGEVAASLPGVERITRSASGLVVAYYTDAGGARHAAQIDPSTGAVLAPYEPSGFFAYITELHRSLFFGQGGHAVAGLAAAGIALLAISGVFLLAARMGGWRQLFARVKGTLSQRWHTSLARLAMAGLIVTALSGLYMSAVNFGFVSDGSSSTFAFPPTGSGGTPAAVDTLGALVQTPLASMRELIFPAAGDAADVFTITTSAGQGYIVQATGAFVSFTRNNLGQQIYETIYMLHTGQGLWWFGLLLGISVLAVPALAITGTAIWWRRRRQAVRLTGNAPWRSADTVLLYGTETNATLSFAASVHEALTLAGHAVHTAPMNTLRDYPRARRLLILTSTYGDGAAPASASQFLSRLDRLAGSVPPYAVLGFGDRNFASYCGFAETVEDALAARGAQPLLMYTTIDRQSDRDFMAWTERLGAAVGEDLNVVHKPVRPRTQQLVLAERQDFGVEVQAPTAVLRFVAPSTGRSLWSRLVNPSGLPSFAAGDLVGIVPPGSTVPRYYSLASSSRDGELEICVRKMPCGVCSEFLHGLAPGEAVDAFIRPNPDFRPVSGRKPMILVGAGTGVAPLAGFVRHNRKRPAYLFFGGRHPRSDFLYRDELIGALDDGRLDGLDTAFSRIAEGEYVQDRVTANATLLRKLVGDGAQIFVCGGLDMARGVRDAFDQLLAPLGMTAASLKAHGRYFEDAY